MPHGLSGIILAGGQSRRMGQPKALMPWADGLLIDAVIARLQPVVDEILIVTKSEAPFVDRDVRVVIDEIPGLHPYSGLVTGLRNACQEISFVCACDMPYLNGELISYLAGQLDGYEAVVPVGLRGLEPLHAVYARHCLDPLRRAWQSGERRLHELLASLHLRLVRSPELSDVAGWEASLVNVNTPATYRRSRRPSLRAVVDERHDVRHSPVHGVEVQPPDDPLPR